MASQPDGTGDGSPLTRWAVSEPITWWFALFASDGTRPSGTRSAGVLACLIGVPLGRVRS
jgi:hypothetical protein